MFLILLHCVILLLCSWLLPKTVLRMVLITGLRKRAQNGPEKCAQSRAGNGVPKAALKIVRKFVLKTLLKCGGGGEGTESRMVLKGAVSTFVTIHRATSAYHLLDTR